MERAIALVGVTGTLLAALLTQVLAGRAERRRRAEDDRTRWLAERRRVSAEFIAGAVKLERELHSAAAQLDNEERDERLPGFTTVFATPEEGVPPVLDRAAREILVEASLEASESFGALELLEAEVAPLWSDLEAALAFELMDAFLGASSRVEAFARFDDAYDALLRCQAIRKDFLQVVRSALLGDHETPMRNRWAAARHPSSARQA